MTKTTASPITCPKCGLENYYFRQGTREYVCKKCGAVWPAKP